MKITEKKEVWIISQRSVMGALADYAVQQSPYHRPDNLEVVLDKFHELIKADLNESMDKYILKFDTFKECHDWIASRLMQIPEFVEWNNRKNGREGMGFTSAGHHEDGSVTLTTAKADDDFIDLDALTRNVTRLATQE